MDTYSKKDYTVQLIIAVTGAFAGLYCVILIIRHVFAGLPLGVRIPLSILMQWLPAAVPVIIAIKCKNRLGDFGFSRHKLPLQLLTGCAIAGAMSLVLTVLPILSGFKDMVGGNAYDKFWMFAYSLIYQIIGVAAAEEFIFRGFIFHRLTRLKNSKAFAIIVSSLLFGMFHIFSGDVFQIAITAVLGAFWCICREKIKHCSTLSLITAHGLYNMLIGLWLFVL